jgi:hypothetical protein
MRNIAILAVRPTDMLSVAGSDNCPNRQKG